MNRRAMLKTNMLVMAAVAMLWASEAQATAILTPGNVPQTGDENISLNTGAIGNPIFGETNETHLAVRFASNESLTANGQGIEATDGFFTLLTVDIPTGSFSSLILNLDATVNGTVTFTTDMTGASPTQTFVQSVGASGSNFFTFTTIDAQRYHSITLQATTPVSLSFSDAAQFRIGGAEGTQSVPDGGMTLSLLGSALVGMGMLRRRSV